MKKSFPLQCLSLVLIGLAPFTLAAQELTQDDKLLSDAFSSTLAEELKNSFQAIPSEEFNADADSAGADELPETEERQPLPVKPPIEVLPPPREVKCPDVKLEEVEQTADIAVPDEKWENLSALLRKIAEEDEQKLCETVEKKAREAVEKAKKCLAPCVASARAMALPWTIGLEGARSKHCSKTEKSEWKEVVTFPCTTQGQADKRIEELKEKADALVVDAGKRKAKHLCTGVGCGATLRLALMPPETKLCRTKEGGLGLEGSVELGFRLYCAGFEKNAAAKLTVNIGCRARGTCEEKFEFPKPVIIPGTGSDLPPLPALPPSAFDNPPPKTDPIKKASEF